MSSKRLLLPADTILDAYSRHNGNKTAAAAELGIHRTTFGQLVTLYGANRKAVAAGSTRPLKHNILPLPPKGKVYRYICSSAQNNTKVFAPFLFNLEAYAEWLGDCRIMVARFTYNKMRFSSAKSQKPGKVTRKIAESDQANIWFHPSLAPYVIDDPEVHGTGRWQLAPDLFFCGEMQIEPSASTPLSGLDSYMGEASSIFPHTKVCVTPVATVPNKPTKHLFTTGTLTGRNYIQKKAGLKAEFHHEFGAIIVEVDSNSDSWVRHLGADKNGDFYDVPEGNVIKVSKGQVTEGNSIESINWGDTHVEELPEERKLAYWGTKGKQKAVIDCLRPKYQFHNDLQSFRARNHHEMNSFENMLKKYIAGDDSVECEIQHTADFLSMSEREGTLTIIVRSNHDRAPERWLDHADYRADYANVEFFLEAQLARVKAIKAGEDWMFLEWALRRAGAPETVRFLRQDESFTICNKTHPIECGLHGDIGPNGSRGTTMNLSKLGAKANKGHSHAYCKIDGAWSAGTLSLDQGYNHGPSNWSVTSIITYPNSKRTGLVERNGKTWA